MGKLRIWLILTIVLVLTSMGCDTSADLKRRMLIGVDCSASVFINDTINASRGYIDAIVDAQNGEGKVILYTFRDTPFKIAECQPAEQTELWKTVDDGIIGKGKIPGEKTFLVPVMTQFREDLSGSSQPVFAYIFTDGQFFDKKEELDLICAELAQDQKLPLPPDRTLLTTFSLENREGTQAAQG